MVQRLKPSTDCPEGGDDLQSKTDDIQKLRFLKIFRKEDESDDKQTLYNLEEILEKSQSFLNDKVFEIDIENSENAPDFKYVHLKIKNIKNERKLIQIIDMSDKMLYNEVKAEQKFQTLMNAAVSHELRNPLSALIGGIQTMKSYLENILYLIDGLKEESDNPVIKLVVEKLSLI